MTAKVMETSVLCSYLILNYDNHFDVCLLMYALNGPASLTARVAARVISAVYKHCHVTPPSKKTTIQSWNAECLYPRLPLFYKYI